MLNCNLAHNEYGDGTDNMTAILIVTNNNKDEMKGL